jgi:hypothetical protein
LKCSWSPTTVNDWPSRERTGSTSFVRTGLISVGGGHQVTDAVAPSGADLGSCSLAGELALVSLQCVLFAGRAQFGGRLRYLRVELRLSLTLLASAHIVGDGPGLLGQPASNSGRETMNAPSALASGLPRIPPPTNRPTLGVRLADRLGVLLRGLVMRDVLGELAQVV